MGYTVVDTSTVVATHLNQLLMKYTQDLLGHDEVQNLIELLAKKSAKLAEELPGQVPVNVILAVLKNLLIEHVPIRDMRTIAETLVANAKRSQDPAVLTASVRVALRRVIVQNIIGGGESIPVVTLDPNMEQLLLKTMQQSMQQQPQGAVIDDVVLEPGMAERLQTALEGRGTKTRNGWQVRGITGGSTVAKYARQIRTLWCWRCPCTCIQRNPR